MKPEHQQQSGPDRSESDEGPAERLGHQLGYAFGRFNHAMHHLGSSQHPERAQHTPEGMEQSQQADQATASSSNPHMSRAEEIVDDVGHRLNTTLSRTSAQFQKAGSRIREEAEDILAEAHHVRTPHTEEASQASAPPKHRHHKARESR